MDYHALGPRLDDKRLNKSSTKLDRFPGETEDPSDPQENVPPRHWISMRNGGGYSRYNGDENDDGDDYQ